MIIYFLRYLIWWWVELQECLDKVMLKKALKQFALSDEVAKIVGLPERYIPTYLARGKLPEPVGRLGRYHVWDREDLKKWKQEKEKNESPSRSAHRPKRK
jgi:hypothetical protein